MHTKLMLTGWLLLGAVACGSREPDYEQIADNALANARLSDVNADYDSGAGVVHLKGTVSNEEDRKRSGDVVQQALPSGARVANEVAVAGGHETTADDLDEGIETRLQNVVELDETLKTRSVSFDANNGVVTITGRVASDAEKARVEQMARQAPGVRDVVNSLDVRP